MENEILSKGYVLIKPHHFLDYLYDLAIDNRHTGEENILSNNNALLCCMFIDGKMKKIKYTPFVDDICYPCSKLADHKRCTDYFDDVTTLNYGFRYKNDFNYQLDLKLNAALPDVFCFDRIFDMSDILVMLKEKLTNEIIGYYLWNRENRNINTFIGIEKAIQIYRDSK